MKLSPLKKTPKLEPFATFDIETMKWTKFIVLGFYDGNAYHEFRSMKKFIDFLEVDNADIPRDLFAHFGGKFDFMFVLRELLPRKRCKILQIIPRGASLLSITFLLGGREYVLWDSSALLPFSLKSLTENFGVETLKQEWDHSKTTGYTKELGVYLYHDVKGLYECLQKFFDWDLVKKAGPARTMASQAMRVLRLYLDEEIQGPGDYVNEFARKAYFGGRVEIFRPLANEAVTEYDVNSLYPFVMSENFFPAGPGQAVFKYDEKNLGIYDCQVKCPDEMYLPALGIIKDGKYIFPTGRFNGFFTSAEIKYARKLKYEIKVISGIVFKKKKKIFSQFISDLYAIRQKAQKKSVDNILAKLLMNSCYGRWGMKTLRENLTLEIKPGTKEYRLLKIKNKKIMLFTEPVELKSFTHVAVAAFVTSYARIHMHKLMREVGEKKIYYTDTDSIFVPEKTKVRHSDALGALKKEKTYENGAVFLLPKTYIASSKEFKKIVMKGFDGKKIKGFELDDFKNALEGDLSRFKITNDPKFASLKQALSQNKIVAMTKKSEKQLKKTYDKRIVKKNKKTGNFETTPINLREF